MEQRQGKIIIHASGGTAAKGSSTYKLTLPSLWIKEMGISEQDRNVDIRFDGKTIIISKRLALDDFTSDRLAQGHILLKLSFYNINTLCTTVISDMTDHTLRIENHTDNIIKTAFGNNFSPTWDDLQQFLEERCVPRTRSGIREYLETIGVGEYDPIEIIKKTKGRMAEDDQWLDIEELI